MLTLYDIAMLAFSCVAANHLGLVAAIEKVLGEEIPIVNCPKCFTFWAVLLATLFSGWNVIAALAVSFLCAWSAIWLDLLMGIIDYLYIKVYDTFYPTTDTSDTDTLSASDPLPDLSDDQGIQG